MNIRYYADSEGARQMSKEPFDVRGSALDLNLNIGAGVFLTMSTDKEEVISQLKQLIEYAKKDLQ